MKTKLLLIICMFGLLSSCIKDYNGGSIKDIELTEDNYLYEGDLYQIYLEQEIEKLDVDIQILEDIIANNQADQTTLDQLEAAKKNKIELNLEIESVLSLDQVGRKVVPPRPPCPRPNSCNYSFFEYFLAGKTVKGISIKILDEGGKVIGGRIIDDLSPLPDTKGLINFSKLNISPYSGAISIEIEVFDETSVGRNYILDVK